MNANLQKAKNSLIKNGYTCVLSDGTKEYSSALRGVKPLIDFLESGINFKGFVAADKTVGAGAAYLYVLLKVESVFARVISEAGERVLKQNGISVFYDTKVPYIINRAGNGACPIETAVKDATSPENALATIKQTLQKLNK